MKHLLPLTLSVTLMTGCNAPFIEANVPAALPPTTDTGAQAGDETVVAIDGGQLAAYRWRLDTATDNQGQRIDALFVHEDRPITLVFNSGGLSILNTCNRMRADYMLEGTTLNVAPMVSTQMACLEVGMMVQEAVIGSDLEGTLAIRRLDASLLELVTIAGNVMCFRSAPLAEDLAEGALPIKLEHAQATPVHTN